MPLVLTDTGPAPPVIADPNAAPEGKTYKKAKPKEKVLRRSMINFQNASNMTRKQTGLIWSQANLCPMWKQKRIQKKDKKTGKLLPFPTKKVGGKTVPMTLRGNRVLSSSTLRTIASGAAASVGAMVHAESRALRCDTVAEDARYPMLPPFGVGASMATEAAFTAYIQEIFSTAVDIKNAVGLHKKVTTQLMRIAADLVNARVAAATAFVPPSFPVLEKPRAPVDPKKAKEQEEQP